MDSRCPVLARISRTRKTSSMSCGFTILNAAFLSFATLPANGLPVPHLLPAANLPLLSRPLLAVCACSGLVFTSPLLLVLTLDMALLRFCYEDRAMLTPFSHI